MNESNTEHDPSTPVGPDERTAPENAGTAQAADDSRTAGGERATPEVIRERVIAAIRECYDPEIPVNVYDLGLIYDVDVDTAGSVHVEMTLTSPACPVAGSLPPEIEERVRAAEGVTAATVEVVWDPPWTPDLMTEAAKLELGL